MLIPHGRPSNLTLTAIATYQLPTTVDCTHAFQTKVWLFIQSADSIIQAFRHLKLSSVSFPDVQISSNRVEDTIGCSETVGDASAERRLLSVHHGGDCSRHMYREIGRYAGHLLGRLRRSVVVPS